MLTSEFLVELYPEGSIIIEEGTVADRMFFLNHGRVEVNTGRDMAKVAVLQEGSIFGEMACLGGLNKRQCTVRALEFCDCRSILRWSFEALLKRFPTERAFFAKLSDRRFKKLTQVRQNDNNTGMKSIASKWQGPGRRKVAPETATFCDSRTLVSQSSPLGASLTSTASSTHVGTGNTEQCAEALEVLPPPELESVGNSTPSAPPRTGRCRKLRKSSREAEYQAEAQASTGEGVNNEVAQVSSLDKDPPESGDVARGKLAWFRRCRDAPSVDRVAGQVPSRFECMLVSMAQLYGPPKPEPRRRQVPRAWERTSPAKTSARPQQCPVKRGGAQRQMTVDEDGMLHRGTGVPDAPTPRLFGRGELLPSPLNSTGASLCDSISHPLGAQAW